MPILLGLVVVWAIFFVIVTLIRLRWLGLAIVVAAFVLPPLWTVLIIVVGGLLLAGTKTGAS